MMFQSVRVRRIAWPGTGCEFIKKDAEGHGRMKRSAFEFDMTRKLGFG
jgi:hypothetical protein